ncbi:hypothetical protein B0J13DRAFT_558059, partial [Dactylonectria estremocensis]
MRGILEKTPYFELNGMLFASLFLCISVFTLCCALFMAIGNSFWVDAALVFSLSLPVFPATAIMAMYKSIEQEVASFGYVIAAGNTQFFGWASLGCSAGAVLIAVGVFF